MDFYHIDKDNSLLVGETLSLIPFDRISNAPTRVDISKLNILDGLSHHGQKYLCSVLNRYSDKNSTDIELVFELIRQLYFPNCISRFQSIFCCPSIDDLQKFWWDIATSSYCSHIVTMSVPDGCYSKHDASFLNLGGHNGHCYSNLVSIERAFHYWNGDMSSNPQIEYLVKLPVTITQSISVIDYLCNSL